MTKLELVFAEIEKLPPAEQNEFVAWILEALHSEQHWAKLFAKSGDVLSNLGMKPWRNIRQRKQKNLTPKLYELPHHE